MDETGYQALRGAVDPETIAAYAHERRDLRDGLLVRETGAGQVSLATQASDGAGAIDPYAISPAARALLLPDALLAELTERFDDPPLLFDAAEAAAGAPDDHPYRNATHVALASEPETLTTTVTALAQTTITVFPGSQTLATTPFSGRYRHHNPERDGAAALERHRAELQAATTAAPETITLAAGDVLVLHADLVHGPPAGAALVAHLCPARVRPGWFAYRPERAHRASHAGGRAWITTQHYDLVDAVTPEAAPEEAELERVEDALRAHDEELATEPPPGAAQPGGVPSRRTGGLVDSVRGIIGRRGRGS